MDNGLIFPYPRMSVQDESACTNLMVLAPFGGLVLCGILGGSSRAMG
jgi:hypothetical protein